MSRERERTKSGLKREQKAIKEMIEWFEIQLKGVDSQLEAIEAQESAEFDHRWSQRKRA